MKKYNKNNITLCIETTSQVCSVALFSNKKLLKEYNNDNGLNHSITLFTAINNILNYTNTDSENISLIKVSNGPGSFTGIRIGVACAIGLSKMYNTKIEYVDTLDAIISNVNNNSNLFISMIDAKNDRVYFSIYDKNKAKLINDSVANVNDLIKLINKNFSKNNIKLCLAGNGAINYKKIFEKDLHVKYVFNDKNYKLSAKLLNYYKGRVSDNSNINYILASKAEREYNEKH